MLKLVAINEQNWLEVRPLSVGTDQEGFLDSAVGILARGYVYRSQRARVLGIERGGEMIGVALVKDLDEEPACYDLQQFMVDARWQGKGYGTEALRLILAMLEGERKYDCVEVCVKRTDAAALRVYEKAGFTDTGYVDEAAPDCLNLMFRFEKGAEMSDLKIVKVDKDTPLAAEFLQFVENCSWVEVKDHIAEKVRTWDFIDWETMFAAVQNGKIVGMASALKTDYYPLPEIFPWVSCVFVSEEYRGRRISGKLIDGANGYLKACGFTRSYIPSEYMGLYEHYGYRYLKDIVNYGGGTDHLFVKEFE